MNTFVDSIDAAQFSFAAQAAEAERAGFLRKTYAHLAGAIVAFVALEAVLLNTPIGAQLAATVLGSQFGILIFFGGFLFVSWIANRWAVTSTSKGMQYAGLSLYVVAEAIFFAPILYYAERIDPNIIPTAGGATLILFGVLTLVVFVSGADFSFLRTGLMFGGVAAFGLILFAIFTGFVLGPIFTVAMIAFACAFILYDTSNVLHHYRVGQHVAASLALFASVALLFWYIVRLLMISRD